MLAFMQGPASTPSGSQAQVSPVPSALGKAAEIGLQYYTGINAAKQQAKQVESQTQANAATASLAAANTAKAVQETEKFV